jgi:hypothetical protein
MRVENYHVNGDDAAQGMFAGGVQDRRLNAGDTRKAGSDPPPNPAVHGIKAAPLCGGYGASGAVLGLGDARPARSRRLSGSGPVQLAIWVHFRAATGWVFPGSWLPPLAVVRSMPPAVSRQDIGTIGICRALT